MSNSGIIARVRGSIAAIIATPLWVSIVVAEGVLALVATSLTVLSRETNTEGLDAGRMALSFTTLLVLAFGMFTVPAIVERVRASNSSGGFVDAFLTTAIVSASLLLAAVPAILWAVLATGVDFAVWMSALSALKFEFAVVILLVTVAFWSVKRAAAATALSYAAIASLVVGPFAVLGVTAALPGAQQTTEYWMLDWGTEGEVETDPITGYPLDPQCPTSDVTVENVPRYDLVWQAASVIPFVLVSESVEPTITEFVNTMYMDESEAIAPQSPKELASIDLFTSIAVAARELQVPPTERIVINECTLLEETGEPYAQYPWGPDDKQVLASTQSGFTAGLMGQGAIVGAWVIGLLVIPRIRRQK